MFGVHLRVEANDPSGDAALGNFALGAAMLPFAVSDLLKAGAALDRNGLTRVRRSLQKKGSRVATRFPTASGSAAQMNEQRLNVLNAILTDPDSRSTVKPTASFGQVIEMVAPNGQGARYTSDGKTFIGFINK